MNKQRKVDVCVISDCDAWHSYESMRVICVVDKTCLQEALDKIKKDHHYSDEDMQDYIHVDGHTLNDLNEI